MTPIYTGDYTAVGVSEDGHEIAANHDRLQVVLMGTLHRVVAVVFRDPYDEDEDDTVEATTACGLTGDSEMWAYWLPEGGFAVSHPLWIYQRYHGTHPPCPRCLGGVK